MKILHERTLEKQVNNTFRESHIPSSVWLQNWRAESIWYVVSRDLTFASLLVWFSCPLASNVQFLTFSRSENLIIWDSPDTSLWCTQKCHFPNHGISLCFTARLLCSPVSIPLIFFWGGGPWSPCPFPNCLGWHSVSSLLCPQLFKAASCLALGRDSSYLLRDLLQLSGPSLQHIVHELGQTCIKMCDRWVQISSVAGAPWHPNLSHWLTHGHYNFPTSLVGFSLPSTVGVSSSWLGFGFYFLYHNQKQKSLHPFS